MYRAIIVLLALAVSYPALGNPKKFPEGVRFKNYTEYEKGTWTEGGTAYNKGSTAVIIVKRGKDGGRVEYACPIKKQCDPSQFDPKECMSLLCQRRDLWDKNPIAAVDEPQPTATSQIQVEMLPEKEVKEIEQQKKAEQAVGLDFSKVIRTIEEAHQGKITPNPEDVKAAIRAEREQERSYYSAVDKIRSQLENQCPTAIKDPDVYFSQSRVHRDDVLATLEVAGSPDDPWSTPSYGVAYFVNAEGIFTCNIKAVKGCPEAVDQKSRLRECLFDCTKNSKDKCK